MSAYIIHITSHDQPRKTRDAIIPDLHAHNMPRGKQVVDKSGASSTEQAFYEVKTFYPCKTRYKHNNWIIKPADRRAKEVKAMYKRNFVRLDKTFAAAVVGDGSGDIQGHFELAQGWYLYKGIVPSVQDHL